MAGDITGTTGNFTTSLSAAALSGDGRALTTNSTISLAGDLGGSVALDNLDGTKTVILNGKPQINLPTIKEMAQWREWGWIDISSAINTPSPTLIKHILNLSLET